MMTTAIEQFCRLHQIRPIRWIGGGTEGTVWETGRPSVVKGHEREPGYSRERDAYLRLRERGISLVRGLRVPTLVNYDDENRVVEMTLVSPPFLVDFGSARLDVPIDFSHEVIADWHNSLRERFGKRFDDVLKVLIELEARAGVILYDVHPDNLKFGDHCDPTPV